MPAFAIYEDLMDAIEADVVAAWSDSKKVFRGMPRTVQTSYPYAAIILDENAPLSQEPDSVQGYTQTPNISVVRVNSLPADKSVSVQSLQVADANLLIARLERSFKYLDANDDPLAADPVAMLAGMASEANEKVYSVEVRFTCSRRELHTSKQ